jgi:hypothetical protein
MIGHAAAVVIGLSTISLCIAQEPKRLPSFPSFTAAPASLVVDSPANGPVSTVPATVIEENGNSGDASSGGFLTSDRGFPNFIGFVSNPTRNFDPRSLTQLWPIFTYAWTDPFKVLPSGQLSAYPAGLNLALTERLSIGLISGGGAWAHFNRQRTGWLNLAGFAQYTLIRDTDDQFLLTGGLIWEAPSGSKELFQGSPPAYMGTYLTAGKEFGEFHVLATTGYYFALESATATTNTYYANFHFDRRIGGWFYPLVEFNGTWSNTTLNFTRDFAPGLIELGQFDATGGNFTVAPGFNAVLVQDRLELGAIYETPIWSQRGFNFNSLLVKMIVRF